MTSEDLETVHQIERRAYSHPWTLGNFRDCLESGYLCWLALDGEEIIGYGILMDGVGEGHILNCCVTPERQGEGIGRRLMLYLMQLAPAHGMECLFLEVRASNERASRLYEGLGFVTVGLRRRYYPAEQGREDAIVMRYCL